MVTNELQKRIQNGDREAFRSVYTKYGRDVYLTALHALSSEEAARGVVKQTFLSLHHELMHATEDVDISLRVRELAENELLLLEILKTGGGEEAASAVAERAKSTARARTYVEPDTEPEDEAESAIPADLPPLERTRAYMRADNAPKPRPSGRRKALFPIRPESQRILSNRVSLVAALDARGRADGTRVCAQVRPWLRLVQPQRVPAVPHRRISEAI